MSILKVDTIQSTTGAGKYLIKSWTRYDGVTPVILGSGNVASVTDNGTGDYTINFENSFSSTAYSYIGKAAGNSTFPTFDSTWTDTGIFTTSAFQTYTGYSNPSSNVANDTDLHAAFIN